jgi:hypothetical protein
MKYKYGLQSNVKNRALFTNGRPIGDLLHPTVALGKVRTADANFGAGSLF